MHQSQLTAILSQINTNPSQTSYPNICPSSAGATSGIPISLAALLNPIPVDQQACSINQQTPVSEANTVNSLAQCKENQTHLRPSNSLSTFQPQTVPLPVHSPEASTVTRGEDKPALTLSVRQKRPITNSAVQKRKATKTSSDSDAASTSRSLPPAKERSRVCIWEQVQKQKYKHGQNSGSASSNARFRTQIFELDPQAVIKDSMTVRHFKCGKFLVMRYPLNATNFKTHHLKCTGPSKTGKLSAGGTKTIDTFFSKANSGSAAMATATAMVPAKVNMPCPGLDAKIDSLVADYLARSGAQGGGASSVTKLSLSMYAKKYSLLSSPRKIQVKTAQSHEWKWRNYHEMGKVYSTSCTKSASNTVPKAHGEADDSNVNLMPCHQCSQVRSSKLFRQAAEVPLPADKNYRFINKEYQNNKLALMYGHIKGLRSIMDDPVSSNLNLYKPK
jgi:hypothetical protein